MDVLLVFVIWLLLSLVGLLAALWFPVAGARRRGSDISGLVRAVRVASFVGLSVGLAAAFVVAEQHFPYPEFREEPVFYVKVVARQFAFEMNTTRVPAGVPVAFLVTSADVNHGFGVYDAETGEFLGQVQAMPGYVNELILVLEPGRYKVVCMEYCGVGHPFMVAEFEAVG